MSAAKDDPIVGHKTFAVDGGGYRHEPLHQSEANYLMARIEANERRIVELMPDEAAARRMLCDAYNRLKNLGWREICYAPRKEEGVPPFEVIEPGSSGAHPCIVMDGRFWIPDRSDLWPSKPILFRQIQKAKP